MALIREGGRFGVKGAGRIIRNTILFGLTNAVLVIYALFRDFQSESAVRQLPIVLLVLAIGVAATAFVGFKSYQAMLLNAFGVIYGQLSETFRNLCGSIIDKFASATGNSETDFMRVIQSQLSRIPRFLQRIALFFFKRLPLGEMAIDINNEIKAGNQEVAQDKLYAAVDEKITAFFDGNNMRWVLWFFALNVIVQLIIIRSFIG